MCFQFFHSTLWPFTHASHSHKVHKRSASPFSLSRSQGPELLRRLDNMWSGPHSVCALPGLDTVHSNHVSNTLTRKSRVVAKLPFNIQTEKTGDSTREPEAPRPPGGCSPCCTVGLAPHVANTALVQQTLSMSQKRRQTQKADHFNELLKSNAMVAPSTSNSQWSSPRHNLQPGDFEHRDEEQP